MRAVTTKTTSDKRIRRVIRYYYGWQMPVVSSTIAAEPSLTPSDAQKRYVIPVGATGANWSGKDGLIAEWTGFAWYFITPSNGFAVYDIANAEYICFDGSAWNPISSALAGVVLQDGTRPLTGDWDVDNHEITGLPTPTTSTSAANKAYVDALVNGLDWQESVATRVSVPPNPPTVGYRILCISPGGSGWVPNYIYESVAAGSWSGKLSFAPQEGMAVFVEDTNIAWLYHDGAWVVFSSIIDHNALSSLQGGGSGTLGYYHLKSTEHTGLTTGATTTLHTHEHNNLGHIDGGAGATFHATTDEHDALSGTSGTPSSTNKYVTNSDSRMSDARTPTTHPLATSGGYHSGTLTASDIAAGADGQFLKTSGTTAVWAGLPEASTTLKGIVELALSTETTAGLAVQASDTRLPTQDENDALAGTSGTPSSTNKYVTNSDTRNTNARTPTAHALGTASGFHTGTLPVSDLAPGTDGQYLKTSVATPVWTSLPPVAIHASTHQPQSGTDKLLCAAPSTVPWAGTNTEGTADRFARSDHIHAVEGSYAFSVTTGTTVGDYTEVCQLTQATSRYGHAFLLILTWGKNSYPISGNRVYLVSNRFDATPAWETLTPVSQRWFSVHDAYEADVYPDDDTIKIRVRFSYKGTDIGDTGGETVRVRLLVLNQGITVSTLSATGNDTPTAQFGGSARIVPVYKQTTQPTTGQIGEDMDAFWVDTDDSNRTYHCFNQGGTIKKVELT